jgi:hypothetical protein
MTASEYSWNKEMLGINYCIPGLSDLQVDKILAYEREKASFPPGQHFSLWEEADYELFVFKSFLSEDQLSIYTNKIAEKIQFNEKYFIQRDAGIIDDIKQQEHRLNFYRNKFVPAVFSDYSILINIISQQEITKINYLKDEYALYLNKTKWDAIVYHLRHYRSFQPNQLKLTLLMQEISGVWPDYENFEKQMVAPTKMVAEYICTLIEKNAVRFDELVTLQIKLLQDFQNTSTDIAVESIPGWHTTLKRLSREKEAEIMIMNFLLYDKDKYNIN